MGKFMIFTFLLLGWTFYEMSGGADFVPEQREVAEAEIPVEAPTPAVTRSTASPTLISLSLPTRSIEPQGEVVTEVVAPIVDEPAIEEVVAAVVEEEPEAEVVEAAAAAPPPLDLRYVDATRVNMRAGPGTNFNVVDAFDRGTEAEVLLVDATGWAQIRITSTGQTGWMAARLLTEG